MYPLDVKARAIAMFSAGYGLDTVAHELGGPSRTTLHEWRTEANVSGLIREQSEELAIRYGRLLHKTADHLDTLPGDQLAKHLIAMNAVRGTNQDKLRDASAPQQQFNFILVKDAQNPEPTVNAEYRVLEPTMQSKATMQTELPPTRTEPKGE